MDILQQSALAWKKLTEYRYQLVYGYKKNLYPINLTFSYEDYPHLAGFQYLKDISLPNYTSAKIVNRIASHIVIDSYVFIIHTTPNGDAKCDFLCCSAFTQGKRNYEANQRKYALLKKDRIHIISNTTTTLIDKLSTQKSQKYFQNIP